ncbi:hypothetical protein GCM10007962_09990 [Yeosuana aromativorans]|uniref:Uncharacterized protein n=1 Tax=Yeosuana aromativorans TaxID=288019 RepID=A0A8J3BGG8_9FLAO|nr:hypothetical protein GCM10007962_09990 [Yeosuana aromativorans]
MEIILCDKKVLSEFDKGEIEFNNVTLKILLYLATGIWIVLPSNIFDYATTKK